MAGAPALPSSVHGGALPIDRFEVDVQNQGKGMKIISSRADQKGLATDNFPLRIKAQFLDRLSVIFGTHGTNRLRNFSPAF
jgi:hypothetical protein